MLEIRNLSIEFDKPILNVESITFRNGIISGIIGESGSGKTCFLDCLSFDNSEFNFDLIYNGEIIQNKKDFITNKVVYITQKSNFIEDLTCLQHIQLLTDKTNVDLDILDEFMIDFDLNLFPNNLSGGQQQRFALLMVYLVDFEILLLDEITASLDDDNKKCIISIIKKLAETDNKTIILTTHDKLLEEICNDLYEIKDEKLVKLRSKEMDNENKNTLVKRNYDMNKLIYSLYKNIKSYKLIYLIISSIICGICLIGVQLGVYNSFSISEMIRQTNKKQSFITRDVAEGYYTLSLPLENNDLADFLEKEESIDCYYPFSSFLIYSSYLDYRSYFGDTVNDNLNEDKNTSDGRFLFEYTLIQNGEENTKRDTKNNEYSIYPYFDESNMEYYSTQSVDGEGIYITDLFATTLGLTKLDDETYVKVKFLVPNVSFSTQIINDKTKEIEFESSKLITYNTVERTFKVKGILDRQYSILQGVALFYIDYEEYNEIMDQEISMMDDIHPVQLRPNSDYTTILKENGYSTNMNIICQRLFTRISDEDSYVQINVEPYKPRAYTIFSNEKISIIEEKVKAIGEDYYVTNYSQTLNLFKLSIEYTNQFYYAFSFIFLIIVVVFSAVIGYLNKKKREKEYYVLSHFRFKCSDLKNYLHKDTIFGIKFGYLFVLVVILLGNLIAYLTNSFALNKSYIKSLVLILIGGLLLMRIIMVIQNNSSKKELKKYDTY